jgi:MFS family permease
MQSVSYRELLRNNRNFRRLWSGQVVSELGTWFSAIAELGLIRMLSGSALMTTAVLVARLLPFLLIAPLAGVAVDRGNRKRILIAADLIRALIALGYLTTGIGAPVWVVVVCTALMSSTSTFFEAAKNASIANMVSRQEMLTANVLMFSTRFLQLSLGAALGGVTAAKFGYNIAFLINSLSFLASALFLWRIPAEMMQRGGQEESGSESHFISDVREGLAYIWRTSFIRAVILVNIGWATGGGMNNLLFDRIGGREFGHLWGDRGDWGVAALYTAAGAGLFLGMMMARRAGGWAAEEKRAGRYIGWSLVVHGLCWAIAGLMPSLPTMVLMVIISRAILGAEFGFQETLMMRVIPDEYRGRVFTTDRALELATMTVSMAAAGVLLTWTSPRTLMIASGLLSATPGALWLLAMWRTRFSVPSAAVRYQAVDAG